MQVVNDLALVENAPGERPEQVQDNNQQANNAGDRNEADDSESAADVQEETTVPVQESVYQSQDKTGIQDTKPPHHPDTGELRLKRLPTARLRQHSKTTESKFIKKSTCRLKPVSHL